MRVTCINDGFQPKEIPKDKQVKFEQKYTIIKLMKLSNPKPAWGVILEEITLDESNLPYKYFAAERFKPLDSDELILDAIEREINEEKLEVIEI